ncbi:hypothetical protein HDV00_004836 [Rhizophlyctis rosea]|nr:hypothetical protein HDV00_004836 [Rhizophlyctis rosea]
MSLSKIQRPSRHTISAFLSPHAYAFTTLPESGNDFIVLPVTIAQVQLKAFLFLRSQHAGNIISKMATGLKAMEAFDVEAAREMFLDALGGDEGFLLVVDKDGVLMFQEVGVVGMWGKDNQALRMGDLTAGKDFLLVGNEGFHDVVPQDTAVQLMYTILAEGRGIGESVESLLEEALSADSTNRDIGVVFIAFLPPNEDFPTYRKRLIAAPTATPTAPIPANGLPVETWVHIISFIPDDPAILRNLSCANKAFHKTMGKTLEFLNAAGAMPLVMGIDITPAWFQNVKTLRIWGGALALRSVWEGVWADFGNVTTLDIRGTYLSATHFSNLAAGLKKLTDNLWYLLGNNNTTLQTFRADFRFFPQHQDHINIWGWFMKCGALTEVELEHASPHVHTTLLPRPSFNLNKLTLHNTDADSHRFVTSILTNSSNLKELILDQTPIRSVCTRAIGALNLDTLVLSNSLQPGSEVAIREAKTMFKLVKSLTLKGPLPRDFISSLVGAPTLSNLVIIEDRDQ